MSQGGTTKGRLEAVTKEIEKEEAAWSAAGMTTQHYQADDFYMNCCIITFRKVLLDKLGVDADELELVFKTTVLGELQSVRKVHEPKIREARHTLLREQIMQGVRPT